MKTAEPILAPLVARLSSRAPLSRDDAAALLSLAHLPRSVAPGDFILREGDELAACHVLLSGFAHRHRISAEGMRHIVGIQGAGDILNLPATPPARSEDFIQALTPVQVASIPMEEIAGLTRARPAIANALWTEMMAEMSVFRAWISNMGRRDARGRIAHLFCELVMRSRPEGGSDGCAVTLPLSQTELADATGMTSVHVNRTLKALEQEGYIVRQRRRITIPDWDRLTALADFRLQQRNRRPDDAAGAGA